MTYPARAVVLTLAVLAAPTAANAEILVLYGDIQGGGMGGKGVGGDQKEEDFFENSPNIGYGLSVTGRFLFLAAQISHHQYTFVGGQDENSLRTWTQFSAGLDFDIHLGTAAEKKARKGKYLQFSALAGFGVGTGQQVDPPLDNSEISDKGGMLGARFGIGSHVNKLMDFGLLIPIQYGYFIKNGVANDTMNHYQGISAQALLYLRLHIKLL